MFKKELPKRVQQWAEDNQEKILSILLEPVPAKNINGVYQYPVYGNAIVCQLAPGWCRMADGSHVIKAETEMFFLAEARNFIVPCDCDSCTKFIGLQKRCAGTGKT